MVRGIAHRIKTYVEVDSKTDVQGIITPLSLIWRDGTVYEIGKENVLDRQQQASRKVGGTGMRYRVRLYDEENNVWHETFIWHENPLWFVEEKVFEEDGRPYGG